MNVTRTEAIKQLLLKWTVPDLAALYSADMECQVNVAQDLGQRKEESAEYKGRRAIAWTDSVQTWYPFRIPKNANSEPVYEDKAMTYSLSDHAEAIGMTGWNWKEKKSLWVAFDFDAITGHSDKHRAALTPQQLEDVKIAASQIPWVTIRKSTAGKGLHLYVFLPGVPTANHTEHAALGRAILGMMAAITGFDFNSSVDICGGNIWVWARKMRGTDGLTLIKQGTVLDEVPPNWHDHIKVTSSRGKLRNLPQFLEERQLDGFEELCGQRPRTPLDEEHKRLIEYLRESNALWWWDADHHMLVCHTYDLKQAHEKLVLKGLFETTSTGRQQGGDHNCFCFPMRKGAWSVRRYSPGIKEHDSWNQDGNGWTRSYLNREPDLISASRTFGGTEQEKGGFKFREAEVATEAAKALGAHLDLPAYMAKRTTVLKQHKDGRLIVKVKRESTDQPMTGWEEDKDTWTRIFNVQVSSQAESEAPNLDDLVRHLITESDDDSGWVVRGEENTWNIEPYHHVKIALGALGLSPKAAGEVLGNSVIRPWRLVNLPFQPEYPGNRRWNRNAAQLQFVPTQDTDKLEFPNWMKILNHVGSGIDEAVKANSWCKQNGIMGGGAYLKCWIASLFKKPLTPLPYLFLHGPQDSGKSILHESLALLFKKGRGYVRADAALISQSGFNGELMNGVLCVVEEVDLRQNKGSAYSRIKDWVTAREISLHVKGMTPFTVPNSTHWIQCANDLLFCPIFMGDTRVVVCYVKALDPLEMIGKERLLTLLEKEAPDFLAEVLNLELPEYEGRLGVPVIETQDKIDAAKANQTAIELFISENCHEVTGESISIGKLYDRFCEWMDPMERSNWTKQKMTRGLPQQFVKGRLLSDGANWHIGNLSWTPLAPDVKIKPRYVLKDDKLVLEGT